jgi:hypothetical protein
VGDVAERLFADVLAGRAPMPGDIDDLVAAHEEEGQRIEYKAGGWIQASPAAELKPLAKVRKWVAGFANASGGLLVIGFHAPEQGVWSVTGAASPAPQMSLEQWCGRALQDLAGLLPLPRCCVVQHSDGDVALIAVPRARNLVPCVEHGELVYNFRIGESTVPAPSWLLADLVLGRRQHPVLHGSELQVEVNGDEAAVTLMVSNHSMAWAADVRVGIVAPAYLSPETRPMVPELDAAVRIEARTADVGLTARHLLAEPLHVRTRMPTTPALDPFGSKRWHARIHLPAIRPGPCRWKCAVYVLSQNSPPTWFELDVTHDPVSNAVRSAACRAVGDGPAGIGFAPASDWRSGAVPGA